MKSALAFFAISAFLWMGCAAPSDSSDTQPQPPFANVGLKGTDVLIFSGDGTWTAEIRSLKEILFAHNTTYRQVMSHQLNQMTIQDLVKFKLFIFPGGDAPTMAESLTPETHARLREAVQKYGVNYLGFCAGAWIAVAPAPLPNQDVVFGLGVLEGPILKESVFEMQDLEFTLAKASFPDGSKRNLLWYGGPITPEGPHTVIARYPDGNPAISQLRSGQGFVILSGLHPTANKRILKELGLYDKEAIAPEFAWRMLEGAIYQIPLEAF